MGTKNYDVFFCEPSEVSEMTCRVCGAKCGVRRGVRGSTSVVEAMAKRAVLHDYHFCPRSHELWHGKALTLAQAIEESHSPSLQTIMRKDMDDLLAQHPLSSPDDDQKDKQA